MIGTGRLDRIASGASRWRVDAFGAVGWPLTLGLLVLIIYPLGATFVDVFVKGGGLDGTPFRKVLSDPTFFRAVENTAILLVVAGSLALAIGALFAWLNERTDASIGAVSRLAPMVPLLIPSIALSIGWVFLAQPRVGFINGLVRSALGTFGVVLTEGPFDIGTWPGLLFVYTITLVPYAYLVLSPALRNMDTSLEEASRMGGAGPLRTVLEISLPAVRPALASAALLIVIVGVSMFSVPRTIGLLARVDTLSVYIVRLTQESPSRIDDSVAVSVLLLVFLSAVWLAQRRFTRGSRHATISGKGSGGALVRLGPWRWVARAVLLGYLVSVSLLPFIALVIVALQPFWQATIDPAVLRLDNFTRFFTSAVSRPREGLLNSLRLALLGATAGIGIAAIAVTYARQRKGLQGNLILGITKIPAAISHLVIGIALLVALAGPPFRLSGTLIILFLGYIVVYMPQASISAEVARGQVGEELLEASAMLGASPGRTFRSILLPLMRPGLAYGWALLFVLIVGDLTLSAILSGPGNLVVGSVFLQIWESGVFAEMATLGTIVCVTSLTVVGIVTTLRRRGGSTDSVKTIEKVQAAV